MFDFVIIKCCAVVIIYVIVVGDCGIFRIMRDAVEGYAVEYVVATDCGVLCCSIVVSGIFDCCILSAALSIAAPSIAASLSAPPLSVGCCRRLS